VLDRHEDALRHGRAVASGIVNDRWRHRLGTDRIPAVTPRRAGRTLARLAGEADLTLFAHYDTDLAGHRGGMEGCVRALERVDRMLEGVLEELSDGCLVVLASDHGNLEDVTAQHTRNPALGLVVGPGWEGMAGRLRRLTDVTPAILRYLGVAREAPASVGETVGGQGANRTGRAEA
jgi:phosphopentomutase